MIQMDFGLLFCNNNKFESSISLQSWLSQLHFTSGMLIQQIALSNLIIQELYDYLINSSVLILCQMLRSIAHCSTLSNSLILLCQFRCIHRFWVGFPLYFKFHQSIISPSRHITSLSITSVEYFFYNKRWSSNWFPIIVI
jgi:hypothetical protein